MLFPSPPIPFFSDPLSMILHFFRFFPSRYRRCRAIFWVLFFPLFYASFLTFSSNPLLFGFSSAPSGGTARCVVLASPLSLVEMLSSFFPFFFFTLLAQNRLRRARYSPGRTPPVFLCFFVPPARFLPFWFFFFHHSWSDTFLVPRKPVFFFFGCLWTVT